MLLPTSIIYILSTLVVISKSQANDFVKNYKECQDQVESQSHQIEAFKGTNADLQRSLMAKDDELDQVKNALTTCQRPPVPESCGQLAQQGKSQSGLYKLDFDGLDFGSLPTTAYCDFPRSATLMGDSVQKDVERCKADGCFTVSLPNQSPNQIRALIQKSQYCYQNITFTCSSARINYLDQKYLSWSDVNHKYHFIEGDYECNLNDPDEKSVSILIEDRDLLPITAVHYGPMPDQNQRATISVGFLTCFETHPQHQVSETNVEVENLRKELKEKDSEIQNLRCQMENSTTTFIPESCAQIASLGQTESKSHSIDFDGKCQGSQATQAYCNFRENSTQVGFEVQKEVPKCLGEGCFTMPISYENLEQIQALISKSSHCYQNITFDCKKSRINYNDHSYLTWTGVNGVVQGIKGNYDCNILYHDAKQDVISIKDKSALPIMSISYGPVSNPGQWARIKIGALTCFAEQNPSVQEAIEEETARQSNVEVALNQDQVSRVMEDQCLLISINNGQDLNNVQSITNNDFKLRILPMEAFNGVTGGVVNDQIMLCGGLTGLNGRDDCRTFDKTRKSWNRAPFRLNQRRAYAASLVIEGRLLITGGENTRGSYLKSTEYVTERRSVPGPDLNEGISGHCMIAISDNAIMIIGGKTSFEPFGSRNAKVYDKQLRYQRNAPFLNEKRYIGHSCATFSNENGQKFAVVVGGVNTEGSNTGEIMELDIYQTSTYWNKIDVQLPRDFLNYNRWVLPTPDSNGLVFAVNNKVFKLEELQHESGSYRDYDTYTAHVEPILTLNGIDSYSSVQFALSVPFNFCPRT